MKTDVLREVSFFPALQLFTLSSCNLKHIHYPDINIKHHGRGNPILFVTASAVEERLLEAVTNEGMGALRPRWQITRSLHMPVVHEYAYLLKCFP